MRPAHPLGHLVHVAGLAPRDRLLDAKHVDVPPRAAPHEPGAERQRRFGKEEARARGDAQRAPEGDEIVARSAEAVQEDHEGAVSGSLAIGSPVMRTFRPPRTVSFMKPT